MATRILLVDDHRVMLSGLRAMLDQEPDLEVVGMAEDGRTAVSMVDELRPDVVLMDVGMPQLNGMEATSQIVSDHPNTKVIALSAHADRRRVQAMLEAGAQAYVTKETAGAEVLKAVRRAQKGLKFLSSDVTDIVVEGFVNPRAEPVTAMQELAGREREVLQLLSEGLTSGEIASQLHISTNTVDTHRRNIMKKLDLHSVAELTKFAIREGLTNVDG